MRLLTGGFESNPGSEKRPAQRAFVISPSGPPWKEACEEALGAAGWEDSAVPAWSYVYELRRDDVVVSTGRLTSDQLLAVDEVILIASARARVREVVSHPSETRLILEVDEPR
jgi:hypothetical protein